MESLNNHSEIESQRWAKLGSAIFFGLSSFLIMIINKQCLTVYGFPSFEVLSLGQIIATVVVLKTAKVVGMVTFEDVTLHSIKTLMPLPLFYVGNMVFGLAGTQYLSLPMYIALRRVQILMTMIGEILIIGERPLFQIQLSVITMIVGAFIAAINDLSFNLAGYVYQMLQNIFTTGIMVYTKKHMNNDMSK